MRDVVWLLLVTVAPAFSQPDTVHDPNAPTAPPPDPVVPREPPPPRWRPLGELPKMPPKKPEPAPPKRLEKLYRYAIGAGISGRLSPENDQSFTLGTEAIANARLDGALALGFSFQWTLRNWSWVRDYYGDWKDSLSDDDRTISYGQIYGPLVAWAGATSMLGIGWHLMLASDADVRPWVSAGTRAVLFIDPEREGDRAAWAHAASFGAGWDFGKVGIGARVVWAPEVPGFGSTSDVPLFCGLLTIEVLADESEMASSRR